MASLSKTYNDQKLLGQVYTPSYIVDKILDAVAYSDAAAFPKKILDPSCGDGRFLVAMVERILEKTPKAALKSCLENVYGWDVDAEALEKCRHNLDALVADTGLTIPWNLQLFNPILAKNDLVERFDFIVGNPPYIRIQHLDVEQRTFIQAQYAFCKKGSTDLYIAFFELCLHVLAPDGTCGLITPNTYFYTETGKNLRSFLAKKGFLKKISNYGAIQLFENATTYSAISIFDKKTKTDFYYEEAQEGDAQQFLSRSIPFAELLGQKHWALSVEKSEAVQGKKLKDICGIHVGITTLADKAYIMPLLEARSATYLLDSRLRGAVEIEQAICRPIIKASKLKTGDQAISEYVLFPYEKRDGKTQIILESDLKARFPLAYAYFLSVKAELDKRDAGKVNKVAWYAFGRSQGLETSFGKKILFSPMNKRPKFILSAHPEATFYSGYCIRYDGDFEALLWQLNSDRMADYINRSARDFQGGWKAYNKRVLEEFVVEEMLDSAD